MTKPNIIILCPSSGYTNPSKKDTLPFAQAIALFLQTHFDIFDITIRIVQNGGDTRLLSDLTNSNDNDTSATTTTTTTIPEKRHGTIYAFFSNDDTNDNNIRDTLDNYSSSPHITLTMDDIERSALDVAKMAGLLDDSLRIKIDAYLQRMRQGVLVKDAEMATQSWYYKTKIGDTFDAKGQVTGEGIITTVVGGGGGVLSRRSGKVRDQFDLGGSLALVTTDRQSGFDRMLTSVPYKGQVLNLTSAFWFEKTKDIIGNHILSVPHPNVSIVKKCTPFPIEFVVRSYLTGSTSTSIWKNYENGVRRYCGHTLPENMTKNQKLWSNIVTPTTKDEAHDRPISPDEIVAEGWMTRTDYDVCATAALKCFALGQRHAAERGLILVDTKYEMGRDEEGRIIMIDEMHTPDSSRYWLASSYEERIKAKMEPENIDKEFLRLWFKSQCDPYKDEVLPTPPKDLVCELSRRYIMLYEMITARKFEFDDGKEKKIGEIISSFV